MQTALDTFEDRLERVKSLHALHYSFSNQLTSAIDLSEILRSEVVLAVSALDFFIHELTRLGMLECYQGNRPMTDALLRFQIPLSATKNLITSSNSLQILDTEIRTKHSFLSFQMPDKIADAVRLFSNVTLWKTCGQELNRSKEDLKSSLSLIVDRRNKIAHEADTDPSYPGQRWPITRAMVENIFDDLEIIVKTIFKVAA